MPPMNKSSQWMLKSPFSRRFLVVDGIMDYPTIISITEAELDLDALLASVTLPSTGAAAMFSGIVRGVTEPW